MVSENVMYFWSYEHCDEMIWHNASSVPRSLSDAHLLFCPICDEPLFLKRGDVRAAHFAHYPDSEVPCSLTPHNLLQVLILRQFRLSVRLGLRFEFYLRSARFPVFFTRDALGVEVDREVSLVDSTRSDLVASGSGKPFIIEVVDTHHMSSDTVLRYLGSGYPVLQLDVVDYADFLAGRFLPERLDVSHFFNLDPNECRCSHCLVPLTLI